MIIKKLIREGFCFAVMQSWSSLKLAKGYTNQEWELIGLKIDFKALKKEGFEVRSDHSLRPIERNPEGIISREMSFEEIREFKELKEEYFIKAKEIEDGAIWELKDKSLKKLYNENY
ncbi:hypothetical protein [Bergeyella zoohelcum]|uniref:Uncharacterized protein n=1 Tax=Bergeyella zoohelcum TaxID=1015 RepID=A0A380ZWI3_9FLAO|nr:hypothetical protein [Bergeyella zoohelcum]EKB58381.1 hypothetical protein HMPREF9700_01833 [Bergeyella zoohelcum CCUG 30536]SUV53158.1 Uncharacterised protein [Bergeyella zoohelcum]